MGAWQRRDSRASGIIFRARVRGKTFSTSNSLFVNRCSKFNTLVRQLGFRNKGRISHKGSLNVGSERKKADAGNGLLARSAKWGDNYNQIRRWSPCGRLFYSSYISRSKLRDLSQTKKLQFWELKPFDIIEVGNGFEPPYKVLQTSA